MIPACLYVSVLCNPCNHTCVSICFCILQPLPPLKASQSHLYVYLCLYLASFATLATLVTIPVCLCLYAWQPFKPYLSVSVSRNLRNTFNHTCLFVYLPLYLASPAIKSVCPSFYVEGNSQYSGMSTCSSLSNANSPGLSHWLSLSPCFSISAVATVPLSLI